MKIMAVRGKNLASLDGEFAVEFAAEPLASAGLFVITGPTGAGKSTLLDALCLALFDKTPRMNRARENGVLLADVADKTLSQNDCRSLLRRGAAEGYAEVDFCAVNGELFRARWSVRRARGRAEGSLQPSEIRLHNLSTGGEEQGGKGELLRRITQLLGLTFEQFTRAVLLAQGDFATFLKAPEEEKADLLEKLTGTEIYSQLSQALYARNKEMQERYESLLRQMDFVPLLTDTEEAALLDELAACRQAEAEAVRRCDELKVQMRWVEERQKQVALQAEAEAERLRAEAANEQARDRRVHMERYDLVQEIRDAYQTVRRCDEERKAALTRSAALKAEEHRCKEELDRWAAAKLDVEKKQLCLKNEWEALADERRRAADLDLALAVGRETLAAAEKAHARAVADLQQAMTERTAQQAALEKNDRERVRLEAWIEKNIAYAPLVAQVPLIRELLAALSQTAQSLDAETRMQAKNETLLQQSEAEQLRLQEESRRLDAMLPSEVYLLRSRLVEGEPCPVCGSRHHCVDEVEVRTMQEQELEQQKKSVAAKLEALVGQIEYLRQAGASHRSRIETFTAQKAEKEGRLEELLSPVLPGWRQEPQLEERLGGYAAAWNDNQAALLQCRSVAEAAARQLPLLDENVKKLESIEKNDRLALDEACRSSAELATQRRALLGGCTLAEVEARHDSESRRLDQLLTRESQAYTESKSRVENLNGTVKQLDSHLADLQQRIASAQAEVGEWLSRHEAIEPATLSELFAHTPGWVADEKKALSLLREQLAAATTRCKERVEALARHDAAPERPSPEVLAQLPGLLAEQTAIQQQQATRLAEINARLAADRKNRQERARIEKERLALLPEAENWERLNKLFGSADGQKFRRIAQGYTLDRLLIYANLHLQSLSSRYTLQRVPERLALQVVDNDMLGEVRSVHTLSGGESFLISLALALGLSSLSSYRMNIESLFIDEGFGSLDAETLRTAMAALEHLQIQGRKIGVISHVAEMTERISVQVQVQRVANGRSRVVVVET